MDRGETTTRWVYAFGAGGADGAAEMRGLLGGKGANLAEMSRLGLPVPPGFTITTEVCTAFYANDRHYPEGLEAQVADALDRIGRIVDRGFGDAKRPLLVSVRSGARASMPGMMDTVLNLGLNDETVEGLARLSGDERFAFDSYRRFIQMYSNVVLGLEHHLFEDALADFKDDNGYNLDTELEAEDWRTVVGLFKEIVQREREEAFVQDSHAQLWGAIGAVFGSWRNPRAETYRRLHDIPEEWGTAVNVQAMVFGNMGPQSATGVAFTRNPSTGENALYGEFLINAQGEDVVAGIRTPQALTRAAREAAKDDQPSMEEALPEVFGELSAVCQRLERHYKDMQDVEFTVEQGRLWMLQTRSGKRTAQAALRVAVEMANDGLIDRTAAVARVDPAALEQLLHPMIDPAAERDVLARGLPASPGAAMGEVVFTADEAVARANDGQRVILCRTETSPEDIHGMHAAEGIVTSRGGMTSHAAVVARGMGRPCVSGIGALRIDPIGGTMSVGRRVVRRGEIITMDGTSGEVLVGPVAMIRPELTGDFGTLMGWADEIRRLRVRANADTPSDAQTAREFGAEGIGLCRTEHMFFERDRILAVREMILADDAQGRRRALERILPMQRSDFVALFTIMAGLPVTVRLLDPPLHEFLPQTDEEIEDIARSAGIEQDKVRARRDALREANPMLGHRGCRLGISFPEIYDMQTRAVFEAAIEAHHRTDQPVTAEIMVPLVATRAELDIIRRRIDAVAKELGDKTGTPLSYNVGTMIELPRAALRAGEIAESAEFFSFGTNDLTQTTFGISRDDSGSFLDTYLRAGIYKQDPFASLDEDGVGELIRIACERGRASRPDLKLGICGEHGGDPATIRFCHEVGLDYVSCSPYRVPIARLAAAQAALEDFERDR